MSSRIKDPFYSSPEWQRVRHQVLIRDNFHCVWCNEDVSGKGKARIDHIKMKKQYPELALDINNLRTLCASCDNKRHSREHNPYGVKREECDESGYPEAWRD